MSVLPNGIINQIEFCEAHVPVWQANPAAIGLSAAQVGSFAGAVIDARKAYDDAQIARQASKAATTSLRTEVGVMRDSAADLIRVIKAFAAQQTNPGSVYALAQIPEPAAPTPAPPPGRARDFGVVLNPDGSVTLSWVAENAAISSGAYFAVSRKLPGQAMFTNLGVAPGTSSESRRIAFTDATIPATAASAGAQYIVQGFRGARPGEASETLVVQFGVDGSGAITSASIKMAA